ncbi:MAG: hypothetical protein IJX38_03420 [Clostridia bacterium]|nr:hypothetical protein [Clostridia bacterium]
MKKEINMRRAPDHIPTKSKNVACEGSRMRADNSINTDPNGSYTGVPTSGEPYEKPVQDVDDL